jgi:hypothetical protein
LELELAGEVSCAIEAPPESGRLFLRAVVGRLPAVNMEAVLLRLLKRNFFEQADPRLWLAVSAEDEQVVVCSTREAHIDPGSLSAALVDLHEEVRAARGLLRGEEDSQQGSDPLDPSLSL